MQLCLFFWGTCDVVASCGELRKLKLAVQALEQLVGEPGWTPLKIACQELVVKEGGGFAVGFLSHRECNLRWLHNSGVFSSMSS